MRFPALLQPLSALPFLQALPQTPAAIHVRVAIYVLSFHICTCTG